MLRALAWLALLAIAAPTFADDLAVLRARDTGGLEARSAALVLSGQEGGELDVSVLALPLRQLAERTQVGLVIDVGGRDLLAGLDADTQLLEIYVYALGAGDQVADFLTQVLDLPLAEPPARLPDGGVKFFGQLELPLGEHSLRILVLQRQTGRLGLRVVPLEIVAEPVQQPAVVAADPARWILVRQAREAGEPDFPLIVGGESVVPATRPWTAAPTGAPKSEVVATREPVRASRGRLEKGYREALRRFAAGDATEARRILAETESAAFAQVLAGERDADPTLVTRDVLTLAVEIANHRGASLVAMIGLHEGSYRDDMEHGRYALARHAREMVTQLSRIYVDFDPKGRPVAAAAFASLGGFIQKVGSSVAAEAVLRQALDVDPRHPPTLLALAASREAHGDHEQAVDLLRRYLDARPKDAEAHLRLAVNLRHLGHTAEAAEHLTTCLEAKEAWIRTLAIEELARLRIGERRAGEALQLLSAAVASLPDEPQLRIQLAELFDRLGRQAEARTVLDGLDLAGAADRPSPRYRYGQWPERPLGEARRELAAAVAAHLGDLAGALDPKARGGRR